MNKNLIIQEPPLQVLPSLAMLIGLNESIVIQQLHYWTENKNTGVEIEGKKWVYNTYENWQEDNFPFWSISTIQRIFSGLEKEGLIISEQFDKSGYDRKKYYRIDYEKLNLRSRQVDTIVDNKLIRSLDESETTTETTTEVSEVDALTTHRTPQLTEEQLMEISESANKTMDGILKYGLQKENYFKGRETIADNHLHYADWYHGVTNQVCTKKAQRSWWKAFREWQDAELSISDLQMSYDEDVKWKKFITDPNELTKKAIAIKASESKKPPQEDQVKTDSSGAPISYG